MMEPVKYKEYESKGFETPSGKVELLSSLFEKKGYDPLPGYVEPRQSPVSTPNLTNEYPFVLVSGSRSLEFFHSEGRQISTLRKRSPDPEITIHMDAAKQRERHCLSF